MSADTKKSLPKPKLICDLSYSAIKRLADRLDLPCDGKQLYWRRLIEVWPASPYDQLTVERFAMNANRLDGSPAYALLTDMSNRGVSYGELVSMLKKLNHNLALHDLGYKEEIHFTKHPQAAPAIIGQRFTLECAATGVPSPVYLWFKERTPLPDQKGPTLLLHRVEKEDEGSYCCRATNEVNVVFSNWAEVKVQKPSLLRNQLMPVSKEEIPDHLEIITQPPPQINVQPGQDVRLVIVARGPRQLSFQWFCEGQPLQFGKHHELVFPQIRYADQGTYSCRVSCDSGGSVLSNSTTIIVIPPERALSEHSLLHQDIPTPQSEVYSSHHSEDQYILPLGPEYAMIAHEGYRPQMQYHPQEMFPVQQKPYTTTTTPYSVSTPLHGSAVPSLSNGHHSPPHANFHIGSARYPQSPQFSDDTPRGQGERADLSKPCYDKVALLIGNKKYRVGKLVLNTSEIDTQDLGGILQSAGFKVVSLVNLTKQEMEQAVKYFISLLGKNVYALFFFAGHGFELASMNYMMPVDAEMDKSPQHCLCAQEILDRMQGSGAKLSIVLLDMCRVQAPPPSVLEGVYDIPSRDYNGYFVYGFSCSPSERAFEPGAPTASLPKDERENSIFVSALKEHFQKGSLNERIDVLLTDAAEGVRRRGSQCCSMTVSWQKPEIRHNMGEPLSLADPITAIQPDTSRQRDMRAECWQNAHCVPDSVMISSPRGELVLRLHFEAEHSNVLVVTAEILNGCLAHTNLQEISIELVPDNLPHLRLKSVQDQSDHSQYAYGHDQKHHKKDLVHFKIPDIQKLQSPTVTLVVEATYQYAKHGESLRTVSCTIPHPLPPPLYAKITGDARFQNLMMGQHYLYTH